MTTSWRVIGSAIAAWVALQGCSVDVTGQKPTGLPFPDGLDARVDTPDDASTDPDAETMDAGPSLPIDSGLPNTGALKPCGAAAHGVREQRERYAHAVVSHYAGCVPEVQVRTCNDGTWSAWSGTASEEQCAVALFGRCSDQVSCAEGSCVNTDLFTKQCLAENGMTCNDDAECVNRCIDGVCADPAPAGGRCEEASDCDVLACVGGGGRARCENATCVCPNGAICTSNAQCLGTCVGLKCADHGVSCDARDHEDCDELSSCVNRRCVRPDGGSCESNEQCENVCLDGTCGPRSGFGGACDEDADCDDGLDCASEGSGPSGCRFENERPCMNSAQCASHFCDCEAQAADGGQACVCDDAD